MDVSILESDALNLQFQFICLQTVVFGAAWISDFEVVMKFS